MPAVRPLSVEANPPRRRRDADGLLLEERWLDENEQTHREGAPAKIEYRIDGSVKREWWYHHGKAHRVEGPAETEYFENGQVAAEYYRLHSESHRYGGPAWVTYKPDGSVWKRGFAIHNIGFDGAEQIARYLLSTSDGGIDAELSNTTYAELLDEGHSARSVAETLAAGVTTLGGIREVLGGAPPEWVRAYEESAS